MAVILQWGGVIKKHRKLSVICMCFGISYIIMCKYIGLIPPVTNYWSGTSLWAVLFILPISAPLILNRLSNRFVELLGKASYDIFLVQMTYFNGASMVYKHISGTIPQIICNFIVCVSVGIIFYYVERPITKLINQRIHYFWNKYKKSIMQIVL